MTIFKHTAAKGLKKGIIAETYDDLNDEHILEMIEKLQSMTQTLTITMYIAYLSGAMRWGFRGGRNTTFLHPKMFILHKSNSKNIAAYYEFNPLKVRSDKNNQGGIKDFKYNSKYPKLFDPTAKHNLFDYWHNFYSKLDANLDRIWYKPNTQGTKYSKQKIGEKPIKKLMQTISDFCNMGLKLVQC